MNICIMLVMLFGSTSAVLAQEQLGQIQIQLSDTDQWAEREGVTFEICKVADIIDGEIELSEYYQGLELDLNSMNTAEETEKAANILKKIDRKADAVIKTDSYGRAVAEQLKKGVYLITATKINHQDEVAPTLVMIPSPDPDTEELLYDITVIPKHSIVPIQESPKTGDTANAGLYVWVLIGATGVAVLRLWQIYRQVKKSA